MDMTRILVHVYVTLYIITFYIIAQVHRLACDGIWDIILTQMQGLSPSRLPYSQFSAFAALDNLKLKQ